MNYGVASFQNAVCLLLMLEASAMLRFFRALTKHISAHVGKIEPYSDNGVLIEYILYFLRSAAGYEQLTKHKKATAQESISIEAIRNVLMPIPPLNEQERIVSAIDTALNIVQKL